METNPFQNIQQARNYMAFLGTKSGEFQKTTLARAVFSRLPKPAGQRILDAACGNGWLSDELHKHGFQVDACEQSKPLLTQAKTDHPIIRFLETNIAEPLPYSKQSFDAVILNMAVQDVALLSNMYSTIAEVIKPDGKLLMTIPNPYYAFPRAVWKRGVWGKLLGLKPQLRFTNKKIAPDPLKPTTTFLRPLSEYVNEAKNKQFSLSYMEELRSAEDNNEFGLQYQLFRYPLILLLEFNKK